jgi:hypothetical protein
MFDFLLIGKVVQIECELGIGETIRVKRDSWKPREFCKLYGAPNPDRHWMIVSDWASMPARRVE